jgi:hypothetical protein
MQAKVLLINLMVFVWALIGVQHPAGIAGEKKDLVKAYESCIVKKIVRCESQVDLLQTSRSPTLRKYAELQDKKAQFLNAEKEMLIDLMIQNRLEPKQYKVDHFLEDQFYRSMAK